MNGRVIKTTHYIGNFVYENAGLSYTLSGESLIVPQNGKMVYQYYMKDHLGNNRVVFDQDNLVVQNNVYYPFGMLVQPMRTSRMNTTPNLYLYNGKELQDDFELDWYDYGARFYDPQLARFHSVDLLAHVEPGWSPYRAFYDNPIYYTDPTGLLEDDYKVGKEGNISLLRETDDDFDMLYNEDASQSLQVDKGILDDPRTNTVTAKNDKEYTFDEYDVQGDGQAKDLFEFIADNTQVEWSLTGIGDKSGDQGKSILTTSHKKASDVGGGYLLATDYTIRSHVHSHPFSIFPSSSDKSFAKSVNAKFPKAKLEIYHKSKYFQYDKSGLLTLPTIELDEIEITPKN